MWTLAFLPFVVLPSAKADNMASHIMNGLGGDSSSSQWSTSISTIHASPTPALLATNLTAINASSTTDSVAASDVSVAVVDLHNEHINQPLGRFGETARLGGASGDIGIPISCLNCSTYGHIEVTAGEFDLLSDAFDDDDLSFSNGHFRATTTGLGGYFELSLASVSLSHTFTLLKAPTPIGFVVPGLGDAGVIFELDLSIGLEFQALTNLTFGFEYSIPDGAFIGVDISDIAASTSHGFLPDEGLKIKTLPVGVDTRGLDFAITATLTPKLQVGFNFFENSTSATAAMFLNIPALRLEEKQLSNVDSQCRAILNGSGLAGKEAFIGDATSFVPSAGFNLGVGAQAGFHLDDFTFSNGTTTMLASTTVTFPGTCIQNGHSSTFPPGSTHAVTTGIATKVQTASISPVSLLFPTATGSGSIGSASSNQTASSVPYPITSLTVSPGTATAAATGRNVTAPTMASPPPYVPSAGAPMTHVGGAAAGLFLVAWLFASL